MIDREVSSTGSHDWKKLYQAFVDPIVATLLGFVRYARKTSTAPRVILSEVELWRVADKARDVPSKRNLRGLLRMTRNRIVWQYSVRKHLMDVSKMSSFRINTVVGAVRKPPALTSGTFPYISNALYGCLSSFISKPKLL